MGFEVSKISNPIATGRPIDKNEVEDKSVLQDDKLGKEDENCQINGIPVKLSKNPPPFGMTSTQILHKETKLFDRKIGPANKDQWPNK